MPSKKFGPTKHSRTFFAAGSITAVKDTFVRKNVTSKTRNTATDSTQYHSNGRYTYNIEGNYLISFSKGRYFGIIT